jgi:hypothetical protein
VTLPPSDYVAPRALAAAAVMDLHDRPHNEAIDVLEDVLLWALRRDPDACRDLLAELMSAQRKPVRVWAIGPLLASLRAWQAMS